MKFFICSLFFFFDPPAQAHGYHHPRARMSGYAYFFFRKKPPPPPPADVSAVTSVSAGRTEAPTTYEPQVGECVAGVKPASWGVSRVGSFVVVNPTTSPATARVNGTEIVAVDANGQVVSALVPKGTKGQVRSVAVVPAGTSCYGFAAVASADSVLGFTAQQLSVTAPCSDGSADMACATFAPTGQKTSYSAHVSAVSKTAGNEGGVKLVVR